MKRKKKSTGHYLAYTEKMRFLITMLSLADP